MRNTLLILLASLSISSFIFGQETLDYSGELVKSVQVPKSPEATAFENYGNVGVSMYSGTPSIAVPIYTIAGRELNLPVSLSYDASGVKVEQLASQVGLSWNLNVGGRISRIVNGLPDNYTIGDYASIFKNGALQAYQVIDNIMAYVINNSEFASENAANDYVNFLNNVNNNDIDAEPDYYSLNVLGISDHIIFDLNTMLPKTLNNPRIKVAHVLTGGNISSWTITNEDGTQFFFNQDERTATESSDQNPVGGIVKEYASSWVLTKIESPNKKDIYEFTYNTTFPFWTQPAPIAASSVANNPDPNSSVTEILIPDTQVTFSPTYKIKQIYLTQIKHNGRIAVTFDLGSRLDISNVASALESITIHDFNGATLKKYDLHHSYFGATSVANAQTKQEHEIRLKLDSIQIKGSNLNRYAAYQFEYFSPDIVTDRHSKGQDYLGYANGAESNSVLYPDMTLNGLHFHGANRAIDFYQTREGTLKKISYPTGGSTTFEYELNEAFLPPPTATTDVQYENVSLSGGNGPSDCGICCQDKFITDPNVSYKIFQITDAGNYDISLTRTGAPNGEAYILNRPNNTIITYSNATNTTTCTANDALWQNMSGQPEETSRFFTAGYYQITLVNKTVSTSIAVRVHRLEAASNVNTPLAGLRVKKITDDPGLGQTPIEKTYQYTNSISGTTSSGKKIYDPLLYYVSNYTLNINNQTQIYSTLNRVASASGGSQPHVVYNKVYEIEQNNGYVEHNFTTGTQGVWAYPQPPFSKSYSSNFNVGKENKTTTYDNANTLLIEDTKEYYDTFLHSSIGFVVKNDPVKATQYVYFEEINGSYFIRHFDPLYIAWAKGPEFPTYPSSLCATSNITCLTIVGVLPVTPFTTIASGEQGNILKGETNSYYTNGSTNRVIDYIYDTDGLLKETKTTDSDNNELKTINYYPGDFSGITTYEDMFNDNRLNTIVKTESYYNSVKTGTQQTIYKKWGTAYLPEYLKASKDNLTLENRINYKDYDTKGNLQEATLINGTPVAYVWGHHDQYPVAKIENATIAQIEALAGFGVDFNLGASGLTITQENSLRNSLPNAMVTTYDYIPLVGVIKITDPRGQEINYHYDDYHRLEYVTDNDGKILSKNAYNYKN